MFYLRNYFYENNIPRKTFNKYNKVKKIYKKTFIPFFVSNSRHRIAQHTVGSEIFQKNDFLSASPEMTIVERVDKRRLTGVIFLSNNFGQDSI